MIKQTARNTLKNVLRQNSRKHAITYNKHRLYSSSSAADNSRASTFHSASPVVGIAGMPNVYKPEHFHHLANQAKQNVEALCERVYATCPSMQSVDTARNVIDTIDEISNQLCLCLDFLELVRCLHPDTQYRSEALSASADFSMLLHELNNDDKLHSCLKQLAENHTLVDQLSELDRYCLSVLKNDMEKYGSVGQDHHDEQKDKLIQLNAVIGQYVSAFGDIVTYHKDNQANEFLPLAMDATDPQLQATMKKYSSLFLVNPDVSGNQHLYIHSSAQRHEVGLLRKLAYIAMNQADPRALDIMDKLLDARNEMANTMRQPTYAHHYLQSLMAGTPEKVEKFLEDLSEKIRPQAESEIELLRIEKMKHEGPNCDPTIYAWDIDYYKRIYQWKHLSETSIALISDYLHYRDCLKGAFMICEKLFGLKIVEAQMEKHESWHNDIKKLQIYNSDTGEYVGDLYLDIFTRKNKIGENSNFCRQVAKTTINQKPVSIVVLDIQAEYLTMSELVSMFHELGHSCHTLLGQTPYQNLSGTRASVDWVEMPSQFMEHFATDYRVLSQFARHYKTMKVLPKSLYDNYMRQKNMFKALQVQSQIVYSMLDLKLHMNEHKKLGVSTTELLYLIRSKYHSAPITEKDKKQETYPVSYHGNLLHLTNYGASYYSYLYAKISSDHLWYKYFNDLDDPLNREAAEGLRKAMSYGGSRKESQLLLEVLGEEPSPSYFLKEFQSYSK